MIIPTGYGQLNFYFTGVAAPRGAQVTIGFENVGDESAEAAATLFGGNWETLILVHQSSQITLDHVKCKLGPNATGSEGLFTSGEVGGDTGEHSMPAQAAMLVTKQTGLGGRKGRGRLFIPGFGEANTDGGGTWNAALLAALQPDLNDWVDAASTGNCPLVLLHNDSTTPTLINSLTAQPLMATQRRRIRKVGGRRTVTP